MNATTIYNLILAKQNSSPNRIWKDVGLALAILTVLLVISQFAEQTHNHSEYPRFALAMLVIAVIELGGRTFSEFKHEKIAYQWLTLPATTTEKWLANFVTSLILVPVGFMLVLTVATMLANLFLTLFGWGQSMPLFNPISAEGLFLFKFYACLHPLLFFGAIYFKKRSALKTFGSLSVFLMGFAFYVAFNVDFLFSGVFEQMEMHDHNWTEDTVVTFGNSLRITADGVEFEHMGLLKFMAYLVTYGYFLFFWGLSYLRLKEIEL